MADEGQNYSMFNSQSLVDVVGDATDAGCDDRFLRRHRLQQRVRNAFGERRMNDDVDDGQQGRNILHEAGEPERVAQALGGDGVFEGDFLRSVTGDHERRGRVSLEDRFRRGLQTAEDAVVPDQLPVLVLGYDTTAEGDDRRGMGDSLLQALVLDAAKGLFPAAVEDLGNRLARPLLNHAVGVQEFPLQATGEQLADLALTGAHESSKKDLLAHELSAVAGRSATAQLAATLAVLVRPGRLRW